MNYDQHLEEVAKKFDNFEAKIRDLKKHLPENNTWIDDFMEELRATVSKRVLLDRLNVLLDEHEADNAILISKLSLKEPLNIKE